MIFTSFAGTMMSTFTICMHSYTLPTQHILWGWHTPAHPYAYVRWSTRKRAEEMSMSESRMGKGREQSMQCKEREQAALFAV